MFTKVFFRISCILELAAVILFLFRGEMLIPAIIALKWIIVVLAFGVERVLQKSQ